MTPLTNQSFVFGGTANYTGYDSMAIAWLIGILQSQFSYCGFDVVYHISEELPDAKRNGPKAAKLVIAVSGIIGWFMLVAVLFCIPDVHAILATNYL